VTIWKRSALALAISLFASSALQAQAVTAPAAATPPASDTAASVRVELPAGLATRDAFQAHVRLDRQPVASLQAEARSRRPGWLLPVAGAVAGGLIGLTMDNGCARNDCMISIPPPVLGVVYGGALGLLIEIIL